MATSAALHEELQLLTTRRHSPATDGVLWAVQPKSGSWTSQRALEAQIATLRQQLDIAAATQMELQKEIEVCCASGLLLFSQ